MTPPAATLKNLVSQLFKFLGGWKLADAGKDIWNHQTQNFTAEKGSMAELTQMVSKHLNNDEVLVTQATNTLRIAGCDPNEITAVVGTANKAHLSGLIYGQGGF